MPGTVPSAVHVLFYAIIINLHNSLIKQMPLLFLFYIEAQLCYMTLPGQLSENVSDKETLGHTTGETTSTAGDSGMLGAFQLLIWVLVP